MISPSTLIISMTSWPPRINAVASAYRAVTCQIEPDMDVHCVLVLCTEEFPGRESSLPKDVLDLGVEILWTTTNTRSHKKLMPTLMRYPDNPILVIDDDTCQVEGWLRTFLKDHAKHPKDIIFGQSTSFCHVDLYGRISEHRTGRCYEIPGHVTHVQKPASGASGTLFPAHTFTRPEFFDEELMMALSPTCDETWQWAFALMEGRTIRSLCRHNLPKVNASDQRCSLIHTNRKTINYIHQSIASRFPSYRDILWKRQQHIVVGLSSYGTRLKRVHVVLSSLLSQTVPAQHIMLCIPKGERSNLGYTTRRLEESGKVEIYEVPVDFGRINALVYTMLRHSSSSTLIVSDSRIYDSTLIERMQMEYFHNPRHVYACDVDTHAGRNLARMTGGILIPPSTIATLFNLDTLRCCGNAADMLLHTMIDASGLSVRNVNLRSGPIINLPDEHDDDKQVNALQIKYGVI